LAVRFQAPIFVDEKIIRQFEALDKKK